MKTLKSIKKSLRNYLFTALGTLILICATNAQAGLYVQPIAVGGPGFGPDGPDFEENFYISYDEDIWEIGKAFQEVGYIDLLFYVSYEPNGDTNGIGYQEVLIDEYIFNDTGITWTDYHLELGYASITSWDDGDECDAVGEGCFNYDFLTPAVEDMGLFFTDVGANPFEISGMPEGDYPNMIWFDDGTVESGESFYALSDFVVPHPEYVQEEVYFEGGYVAVLRQSPSIAAVPAPAAIWLFGIGLLGLGFVRRRKA